MRDRLQFEQFFCEAFYDDRYARELRLSPFELSYIKEFCPSASYQANSEPQADGKTWYRITLNHLMAPMLAKA